MSAMNNASANASECRTGLERALPQMLALIERLDRYIDKGGAGTSSLQVAEAWAYFSGGKPYAGSLKAKTDYTGNTAGLPTDDAVHALPGNALASYAGTQYLAPVGTAARI